MGSLKKQHRKLAAKDIEENWRKLSPKEQIDELDRRLGVGIGAARQRAKISNEG